MSVADPPRRYLPEASLCYTLPGDPKEWYQAALRYWEQKNYLAVKILMGKYVKVDPNDSAAWMALASSHAAYREFKEAITGYQKIRELTPDFMPGRLQLALMHAVLEDWDAARAEYDACLAKAGAEELAEAIRLAAELQKSYPASKALPRALARLRAQGN
jgi:tetratricopeptide (TPR) repeat protein